MHTPILLITFNRPNHTKQVLDTILASGVTELYIFQDAPRTGNPFDEEKCSAVREAITTAVKDSNINLHTLYAETNMGCGPGPAAAITWFFENVEQGIILEDDCLAHPDFFPYCEEMLEYYKNDEQVFCISGNNFMPKKIGNGSYFAASGHHCTWGWASWRRAWNCFNYTLSGFTTRSFSHIMKKYFRGYRQRNYWMEIFSMLKKDQMNNSSWDYQFYFSCWKRSQFALAPNVNLITNIGDDADATHTANNTCYMHRPTKSIMPIVHTTVKYDRFPDNYHMRHFVIPYEYGWSGIKRLPYRLNKLLKRLLGHTGPWIKSNKK